MISLVTNDNGTEIGYLIDDLFIHINVVKAIIDGKISYESKRKGFFEKDKIVIPALRQKCDILSKDYTDKTGIDYLSILRKNDITVKHYIYYSVSQEETDKECNHYLWGLADFKYRYAIYDTKTEQTVGYILTSTDIFSPNEPNLHICMIEIKEKGQGVGTQVIRELLKYRPIRGLADNNSKPFWNKFDTTYLSDSMHFNINP